MDNTDVVEKIFYKVVDGTKNDKIDWKATTASMEGNFVSRIGDYVIYMLNAGSGYVFTVGTDDGLELGRLRFSANSIGGSLYEMAKNKAFGIQSKLDNLSSLLDQL